MKGGDSLRRSVRNRKEDNPVNRKRITKYLCVTYSYNWDKKWVIYGKQRLY